jgi:NAD(P)-dependent dehydrogenase (short-subunit alcohol dehydrogenase family)
MEKWTLAEIPSQAGRLAVVTGANSGIGWHTALELARAGSEVVLASRSESKGREAVERIRHELPGAQVRVMAVPTRKLTRDGFELQLGTNFLGPFALTALLIPALLRSEAPRVTTVASGAAGMGARRMIFEDLQSEKSYGPWTAYCQSKLADVLFSTELARRSDAAGTGILSVAAHPGYARTNLQRTGPERPEKPWVERVMELVMSQDAAGGAMPTLRAATSPDAKSGDYYGPGQIFGLKGAPVLAAVPKPGRDQKQAAQLWELAEKLTGVEFSLPAELGAV